MPPRTAAQRWSPRWTGSCEISPSGYVVGDSFTVADLTAAALFYLVPRPAGFPYAMVADDDLPGSWREFLDSLAHRPGDHWLAEIYRRHRGASAELTPAKAGRPRPDRRSAQGHHEPHTDHRAWW